MEVINRPNAKSANNQLLVIMHLSQLLNYITGFGGLVVPLIIWLTNRDKVLEMDEQGKEVVNFQISTMIYALISIPCILFFGLGILMLIAIGILAFILPIIGAIKASKNEYFEYPFTIRIIK